MHIYSSYIVSIIINNIYLFEFEEQFEAIWGYPPNHYENNNNIIVIN